MNFAKVFVIARCVGVECISTATMLDKQRNHPEVMVLWCDAPENLLTTTTTAENGISKVNGDEQTTMNAFPTGPKFRTNFYFGCFDFGFRRASRNSHELRNYEINFPFRAINHPIVD